MGVSSRLGRFAVPLLRVGFVPLWASGFIVGKLATQRMDVLTTLLWRFVIAAVVMGAVVAITRPALLRERAWLHLGLGLVRRRTPQPAS